MKKTDDVKIVLPDYVKKVIGLLNDAGFEAFAVGGCVRDSLRGCEPHDWDICTAAVPDEVEEALKNSAKIIPTGIKHGTVTVLLRKSWNHPMEVTTFRTESGYDDCRHPKSVEFVSAVTEDLKRRDFTVNAMAYNDDCGLTDPFGGRNDLKDGIIRCVGNADERFSEDALRIMRAMRFAAVCGFGIESATAAAMKNKKELLKNIAAERIYSELKKMICGRAADKVLSANREVMEKIIPECFSKEAFSAENTGMLNFLPSDENAAALRLAAILLPALDSGAVMNRLRSERVTRLRVSTLTGIFGGAAMTAPTEKSGVLKLMRDYGKDKSEDILTFGRAYAAVRGKAVDDWENAAKLVGEIEKNGDCYTVSGLAVCGRDLKRLGLKGGEIRERLELLLDAVICGKTENRKNALLKYKIK